MPERAPLSVRRPGRLALALGTGGLGLLCLAYGDIAPQWQDVPTGFPWPRGLAYASGAILLGGGVALLIHRTAQAAAFALAGYHALWVVTKAAGLPPGPATLEGWLGFTEGLAETLAAAVGCFTLGVLLAGEGGPAGDSLPGLRWRPRAAGILLGVCCVGFGLAHFAFADFTAGMVPRWLPARTGLAWLTGAFHLAAGAALVTGVRARLAARLEALMLGSFAVLVHLPSFATSGTDGPDWAPTLQSQAAELCLCLLVAGSAAVVAEVLAPRSIGP